MSKTAEVALAETRSPTDTAHASGKKHLARFFQTAIPVGLFILTYSTEAKAYTDPGSGAFLMQTALAIVAGGLFFAKSITARVRAFFRQDKTAKQKINAEADERR